MPRGEALTYDKATAQLKRFLGRRGPEARKVYIEMLNKDLKNLGNGAVAAPRRKKAAAPAASPAPPAVAAAGAKKPAKKKAKKKPKKAPAVPAEEQASGEEAAAE